VANTKKILVHRELQETVIIRSVHMTRLYCDGCEAECDFLSLDSAVDSLGLGTREILSRIDVGVIHTFEAPNGHMLVCAESFQERRRRRRI